jgi:uncharacterized membrane protein HdeD (DUF308 family)
VGRLDLDQSTSHHQGTRERKGDTVSVTVQSFPPLSPHDEEQLLRRLSRQFFALGLITFLLGLLAIAAPYVATTKTVVVLGVLLVIAGIAELIHAAIGRSVRGFGMHLLAAALYLIIGVFVLEDPDRVALVLTLLLAASFLAGGLIRIVFSLVEQFPAWPWVLLNGVVDLFLGVLIWRGWPATGDWVIGLFVGIELLFHGWTWMILAMTVRAVETEPAV